MTRLFVVLAALVPFVASAQSIDAVLLGGSPKSSARLKAISGDLRSSFERALARYDEEIAAQPHRIAARIERCRFIETFQVDYEYASFIDELYETGEQCHEELATSFPDHPEVKLWQLERTYDDEERLAGGQTLIAELDARGWTGGQRARLYTHLANASERLDTERRYRERTAEYARLALQHDIRADVRLIQATYFKEAGDRAAALEALTSPFDGHDAEDGWYLVRKMSLLAELQEREAVLAVHAKLAERTGYYDRNEVAAALRAVGETALARDELGDEDAAYYGTADERQRFVLALEDGNADDAYAAYQEWRDAGWREDPIGVNRFALFVAHPDLPWRPRDALGLLGGLGYFALLCALWFAPLGIIHYRGLANRVRGASAYSADGLHLRHAWWGLFAFTLAGFLSLYAIGPIDVFSNVTMPWAVGAERWQLAKLLVIESLFSIVLLAFVAQALRRYFPRWWSTDWSIAKCVLIAAAVALALRLPMLAAMLGGFDFDAALRLDNAMWQMLTDVDALFGAAATLWTLSVAAPVAEEFIFRGLLLRASLKHVSFPLANTAQALLFAAVHFDLAATPFLFVCGLAFGWLARSSGGLLAPIVAHCVFNLVAGLLIIS
jgi:membrane protease YdiL (CAAX protease family)